MPKVSAFRRLRKEYLKFQGSLGHTVSSRTFRAREWYHLKKTILDVAQWWYACLACVRPGFVP